MKAIKKFMRLLKKIFYVKLLNILLPIQYVMINAIESMGLASTPMDTPSGVFIKRICCSGMLLRN